MNKRLKLFENFDRNFDEQITFEEIRDMVDQYILGGDSQKRWEHLWNLYQDDLYVMIDDYMNEQDDEDAYEAFQNEPLKRQVFYYYDEAYAEILDNAKPRSDQKAVKFFESYADLSSAIAAYVYDLDQEYLDALRSNMIEEI